MPTVRIQEEPYQLRLFGKSPHAIEAVTASFLPAEKHLYIAVGDADCNIHILQFDPERTFYPPSSPPPPLPMLLKKSLPH